MGITKPRPLRQEDDRSAFDCGKESLNRWFSNQAWKNQVASVSRTNVVCDAKSGKIVGYVTLASTEIRRSFLAKKHQRNMPDPVPAVLLGQLAVDKDYQGRKVASSLLFFAFKTIIEMARQIGCFAIVTYPLDEEIRAFYQRYGFIDTPFDPDRSMIMRVADLLESNPE